MSSQRVINLPEPGENLLVWSARYGRDAIELLNTLALLEVQLVSPSSSRGRNSLTISAQNAILGIPIKGAAPIDDPIANTSSNTAAIIALLELLRGVGILPRT